VVTSSLAAATSVPVAVPVTSATGRAPSQNTARRRGGDGGTVAPASGDVQMAAGSWPVPSNRNTTRRRVRSVVPIPTGVKLAPSHATALLAVPAIWAGPPTKADGTVSMASGTGPCEPAATRSPRAAVGLAWAPVSTCGPPVQAASSTHARAGATTRPSAVGVSQASCFIVG
jgi:hypothetical protein